MNNTLKHEKYVIRKQRSVSHFRFIVGFPFGLLAEVFARLAIKISGGQLDVDFNYIDQDKYRKV